MNRIKRTLKVNKLLNNSNHILCFHRIISCLSEESKFMREYEYYVDDFENLLNFYLNKGFVFVDLRDLIKKSYPKNKKIVCLTFDDGYRDFQELVLSLTTLLNEFLICVLL